MNHMEKKMDNGPVISILMGVYNAEKTLAAALDSVLAQTFRDFELVICDDASADGSGKILQAYRQKDARIVLLRNEKNLGLGASLNRCLEIAKGRFIARQDADDISAPERLERTLRYLERNDLPYAACGVYIFDDGGVWSRRCYSERVTIHTIARQNPFFHPTMLFRREVITAVNGYRTAKDYLRVEDYDLVMRLAAEGVIGQNLQEYLYYVYEPQDAYLRHTPGTRLSAVRVRAEGLRRMRASVRDYIYLAKPLILMLVPRALMRRLKQLQWQEGKEEAQSWETMDLPLNRP